MAAEGEAHRGRSGSVSGLHGHPPDNGVIGHTMTAYEALAPHELSFTRGRLVTNLEETADDKFMVGLIDIKLGTVEVSKLRIYPDARRDVMRTKKLALPSTLALAEPKQKKRFSFFGDKNAEAIQAAAQLAADLSTRGNLVRVLVNYRATEAGQMHLEANTLVQNVELVAGKPGWMTGRTFDGAANGLFLAACVVPVNVEEAGSLLRGENGRTVRRSGAITAPIGIPAGAGAPKEPTNTSDWTPGLADSPGAARSPAKSSPAAVPASPAHNIAGTPPVGTPPTTTGTPPTKAPIARRPDRSGSSSASTSSDSDSSSSDIEDEAKPEPAAEPAPAPASEPAPVVVVAVSAPVVEAAQPASAEPATSTASNANKLPVRIAGFLDKKGSAKHNWKKRYFELRGPTLRYKENEADDDAKAELDITDGVARKVEAIDGDGGYRFEIVFEKHSVVLRTDSWSTRDEWMAALLEHAKAQ